MITKVKNSIQIGIMSNQYKVPLNSLVSYQLVGITTHGECSNWGWTPALIQYKISGRLFLIIGKVGTVRRSVLLRFFHSEMYKIRLTFFWLNFSDTTRMPLVHKSNIHKLTENTYNVNITIWLYFSSMTILLSPNNTGGKNYSLTTEKEVICLPIFLTFVVSAVRIQQNYTVYVHFHTEGWC